MKVSFLSVEIRVVVPMIAEAHSVDLFHKNAMFNYIILLTMKSIIKNKSNLNFLNKPIESLATDGKITQNRTPNRDVLLLYRDVLKMAQRFTWSNEDG